MTDRRTRKLFVNLAVRDLARSMQFFSKLGFEFDPKLTDDKAACMTLSDQAYVMLLSEPFFRTFTNRELCDTTRETEGLYAITCESRAEVNDLVQAALAAGATRAMEPQDLGFMYGWSFYDPDGHHWEVFWMDPKATQS